MIKYKILNQKTVGFFYFPSLEIGFGIFCIIAAFVFLALFLHFNHHQLMQELFDTVASLAIFIFLMFLGYNLAHNYMYVHQNHEGWHFYQCMTSPSMDFSLKNDEFTGIKTIITEKSSETDEFTEIMLKTTQKDRLLLKTKSASEAKAIVGALQRLYEENNKKVVTDE
jgi:hypothetical protein